MTGYSGKFQGSAAVERYKRKLDNRIDRLRHDVELEILKRYAHGALFDCTIGVGRFIGKLPHVTSYSGMDLSAEFVDHVKVAYPGTDAAVADLTRGIDRPADTFDTVLLLRSLSAIGSEAEIILELVRIARPGGAIIVDYGSKPSQTIIDGSTVWVDRASIHDIIKSVPVDLVECIKVDGVVTRLKRHPRVFRALHSRAGCLVPDLALDAAERLAAPLLPERHIFVLRKRRP